MAGNVQGFKALALRSFDWKTVRVAVCLICVLVSLGADGGKTKSPEKPEGLKSFDLSRPVEMRDFVIYVTKEGVLSEEVSAEIAYLYQSLSIVHMKRVHVNFIKEGTEEKDTLDAPEGYLYLKDMNLTKQHPFFEEIGGENAITSNTFGTSKKTEEVFRGEKDIDAFGRLNRRIVYRNADGTEVSSLRAYRNALGGKLYGVGECEMRRPRPATEDELIVSGEIFTVDDRLTSRIQVRGRGGSPPKIQVRSLDSKK